MKGKIEHWRKSQMKYNRSAAEGNEMNTETLDRLYLSRTGLACLVVNAVAFGGCIVCLAIGARSGPGFLLLIGTGLYTLAGSAGALIAKQAQRQKAEPKAG